MVPPRTLHLDWASWERCDREFGFADALHLPTGRFASAADASSEEIVSAPDVYQSLLHRPQAGLDDDRYKRALLHTIADLGLRRRASEAWRAVHDPMPPGVDRRGERRARRDRVAACVREAPEIAARWHAAWPFDHVLSASPPEDHLDYDDCRRRAGAWRELSVACAQQGLSVTPPPPRLAEATALLAEAERAWEAYLATRLGEIEEWFRAHVPVLAALLRPPIHPAAIGQAESAMGRSLPRALTTLYAWHDGIETAAARFDDAPFFDGYRLLPLEDAQATRTMLNELYERGDFADRHDAWWRPEWLPVLGNTQGDSYCVDLEQGFVVEFIHDDASRRILFSDMDALIEAYADELAGGMWVAEASGERERLVFGSDDEADVTRFVEHRLSGRADLSSR